VVPSSLSYDASSHVATLSAKLTSGQRYTVTAAASPTDAAGNGVVVTSSTFRASTSEQEWTSSGAQYWPTVRTSSAFGGSYVTEHLAGARATWSFSGTSVTLYTVGGPDQGLMQVLIDGRNAGTFNEYSASRRWRTGVTFKNLAAGAHSIAVVATGKKGSTSATGAFTSVDAFKVGSTTTVSPWLAFGWRVVQSTAYSGGKAAVADLAGEVSTFTFRGTALYLSSLVGPSSGKFSVTIDGVSKGTFDEYYARSGTKTIAFKSLPDKVHVFRLTVLGAKQARSSGTLVGVDRYSVA
jgi:hypothetical protein